MIIHISWKHDNSGRRTPVSSNVEERLRFANHNGFAVSEVPLNEIIRMIELKQEINELCQRLGEPPRHEMPSGGGGA